MLNLKLKWSFLTFVFILFFSCKKDPIPPPNDGGGTNTTIEFSSDVDFTANPSGYAPLTAQVNATTNLDAKVQVRVIGKNGAASDVVQDFPTIGKSFEIPILGLYADHHNLVELTFSDENNTTLGRDTLTIPTSFLHKNLPTIEIQKTNPAKMKSGLTLVNYFGYHTDPFPQTPFMIDAFGDIRWYLELENHPSLGQLFFDVGLIRLQNGNWLLGDVISDRIYEVDMFGKVQNQWLLHGYEFHHTVLEKPNGNILATVDDPSKPTREDVIIELGRNSFELVNVWDLNESLQNTRSPWDDQPVDPYSDWLHANGLQYDPTDNTIIVSSRTQGVVKLTEANEVVWILAHHRAWGTAGNGQNLHEHLLQPLDNQGNTIGSDAVLKGFSNHPDFEWNWWQHSPRILPNGNLIVFDNGDHRNFTEDPKYSRAVEYKIDATNMTVQQIWEYGKNRGAETFSRVVSNVEYFEEENNILFAPGAIEYQGENYGKIIELDRATGEVFFEAQLISPQGFWTIIFHNAKRMKLYPE